MLKQGVLTERLGNGLQNRVERFDSARHLIKKEVLTFKSFLFCLSSTIFPLFIKNAKKNIFKEKLFHFYFFKPKKNSTFANVILNTIFLP